MPLPTPHEGESRADFVNRCAGDPVMREYSDPQQQLAVCFSQFEKVKTDALRQADLAMLGRFSDELNRRI